MILSRFSDVRTQTDRWENERMNEEAVSQRSHSRRKCVSPQVCGVPIQTSAGRETPCQTPRLTAVKGLWSGLPPIRPPLLYRKSSSRESGVSKGTEKKWATKIVETKQTTFYPRQSLLFGLPQYLLFSRANLPPYERDVAPQKHNANKL